MKKIEDYINKKVAIKCNTEDEFEKINELIVFSGGRTLSGSYKTYTKDSYLSLFDISRKQNCFGSSFSYENNIYTIYPASDFIQEKIAEYDRLGKPFDVTTLKKESDKEFIKGNWYKCSCNENLYRFHKLNGRYFENNGVINLKHETYGGYPPGLSETLNTTSLVEYFNPNNLADMEVVNIYLNKNKMTKEQILEKAKRDYPVGTIFKQVDNGINAIINEDSFTKTVSYWQTDISLIIYYSDVSGNKVISTGAYLFNDNKWAEIVSKPEKKSLIGRYLKYIGDSVNLPKYGDYFQIQKEESGCNLLRLSDNASDCNWIYEDVRDGTCKNFELMPIGFKPEVVEEQWIPKVGDWVVRLNDSHLGIKVGQVCKVIKTELNNHVVFAEQGDPEGSHAPKNIRKALPHEIPVEAPKVTSKELSIEEIQAECKRRFPIGCEYRCAKTNELYILNQSVNRYEIGYDKTWIDAGMCHGFLYYNGKYAELISLPKSNDNFVLPKKWCVKITNENRDVLNNWRVNTIKYAKHILGNNWIYIEYSGQGLEKTDKITEITFDQFKQFVLKENNKPGINNNTFEIKLTKFNPEDILGKPSLIKPINKIELRIKKVASQPIKKEKKQLIIIKTKQLKLN